MIRVVIQEGSPPIPKWIDVQDPTPEELGGIAENYKLHPNLVQDCMEPAHLPKHERYEDTTFMIIRQFDDTCKPNEDSIQAMTRKIAFFLGDGFLITVHRHDPAYIQGLRAKYEGKSGAILQLILLEMILAAVETYHKPLEDAEIQIHDFETALLNSDGGRNWQKIFRTKCRLMVMKRILWHCMNAVQKFTPFSEHNLPVRENVRERIESLYTFADSLLDDLSSLLNIQMALASNRLASTSIKANEVMKVLTIFSAFFLPMNFIVGVYGMNFKYMPELEWRYGYLGVWGILMVTVATIYLWFIRKKWIRKGHLS